MEMEEIISDSNSDTDDLKSLSSMQLYTVGLLRPALNNLNSREQEVPSVSNGAKRKLIFIEKSNLKNSDTSVEKKLNPDEFYEREILSLNKKRRLFDNLHFYFCFDNLEKPRKKIMVGKIHEYGGTVDNDISSHTTHLISSNILKPSDKDIIFKKILNTSVTIVSPDWISNCLQSSTLVDVANYLICEKDYCDARVHKGDVDSDSEISTEEEDAEEKKKNLDLINEKKENLLKMFDIEMNEFEEFNEDEEEVDMGKYENFSDDDVSDNEYTIKNKKQPKFRGKQIKRQENFACMKSSKDTNNKNKFLTDKLEIVLKRHEAMNKVWNLIAYKKAINSIKRLNRNRYPTQITSKEEALKINDVGPNIAKKIDEILKTGKLRKADYVPEEMHSLKLFQGIYGVGPKIAQKWYAKGYRTLEDIKNNVKLKIDQEFGLKYYDDLNEQMPREEVTALFEILVAATKAIDPEYIIEGMGSYRRGAKECGDVDIIVTHPDEKSHLGVIPKILAMLKFKFEGFLVHSLNNKFSWSSEHGGETPLFKGICKLPGENQKVRRFDILVVPYYQLGASLLYFTGNTIFNRSMRLLARRKGMSLSQHGLFYGVVRVKNEKVNKGTLIASRREIDIFNALGVPFVLPEERNV
ncbi:hypothetical protein HK099_002978 [Clydaea vesicula]|uniref:DNA polymerase n=1 Tax=Clydaea vesicula TaxID=447962 RepID=A0AAD5U5D7_9FUNG|nr:hypothetical protein HK099_002978 [Clydaea vesicula]